MDRRNLRGRQRRYRRDLRGRERLHRWNLLRRHRRHRLDPGWGQRLDRLDLLRESVRNENDERSEDCEEVRAIVHQ